MLKIFTLALLAIPQDPAPPPVHSVCDISQEFSFYMDGRFARQYLDGRGRDARNWGSLTKLDLSNTNLLVLTGGDRRIPYAEAALVHIEQFLDGGGAVLLMADGADKMPPGAALAERFGAGLSTDAAVKPLAPGGAWQDWVGAAAPEQIVYRGGRVLELGEDWTPLLRDQKKRPVLAVRQVGAGRLLLGSRGLFGQNPDASDPVNAEWVTPLLLSLTAHKTVDPKRRHDSTWAEHEEAVGPLTLEYHDGTAPFARAIADEYVAVRPHLVALTGVEPAPGMIKRLLILPTGGGGFSSGERIAIGAWWGNYPENRYPMIELISHEAGHSWVLPYAEPLWNEPIATYLGIQVGERLGMPEAQQTLDRQLAAGRRHDPDYASADPLAAGAPRDLIWGKSYFVFEELERLHGPGALAKYFHAKREHLAPGRPGYSFDDLVAVWSLAVGHDLFGWFRGLGFDVDRTRTGLPAPPGQSE
ncbi:MAG: hypothetical protein ISR76_10540 [Planctomycetes bacterium]|nr:hypothetical protein [Planctomycetota bacterium]